MFEDWPWRPYIYGGLASMTAEFFTFPIDTSKIRLQIQGQTLNTELSTIKYRGMFHALKLISQEEGLKALFSGLSPALLRQATYGTIKIGIYHSLKRFLTQNSVDERLSTNVCCGVIAGSVSSAIANPTDVLKVRLQAQNKASKKQNMLLSFIDIAKKEGIFGLWRGVGPTANRAAIVAGVELPVYDFFKNVFISYSIIGDNVINHFLSSFIAGFAGAIASNPVDVLKTRLMNQRKFLKPDLKLYNIEKNSVIYKSSFDCLQKTVKSEGILALYKGFVPNWLRLGPWNIIFFITFEQLKKLY